VCEGPAEQHMAHVIVSIPVMTRKMLVKYANQSLIPVNASNEECDSIVPQRMKPPISSKESMIEAIHIIQVPLTIPTGVVRV
jgi:hypothetical protein